MLPMFLVSRAWGSVSASGELVNVQRGAEKSSREDLNVFFLREPEFRGT